MHKWGEGLRDKRHIQKIMETIQGGLSVAIGKITKRTIFESNGR